MWKLLSGPLSSWRNGTDKSNIGCREKNCQAFRVILANVVAAAVSALVLFERLRTRW